MFKSNPKITLFKLFVVAGVAGYRLNGMISRITGLDPANPTFRLTDDIYRLGYLNSNDCLYQLTTELSGLFKDDFLAIFYR